MGNDDAVESHPLWRGKANRKTFCTCPIKEEIVAEVSYPSLRAPNLLCAITYCLLEPPVGGKGLVGLRTDAEQPSILARYNRVAGEDLDICSLHVDGSGDLWIGAHMLIRFRPGRDARSRFRTFPTSPELYGQFVGALESDAAGNLWAGIGTLGAARISREPSELFTDADGLESRVVRAWMESRAGKLFAVTGRVALNEFTGDRFVPRPHKLPPSIIDDTWVHAQLALQDRSGRWWVASGSGLLCHPPGGDARSLAYTRRLPRAIGSYSNCGRRCHCPARTATYYSTAMPSSAATCGIS